MRRLVTYLALACVSLMLIAVWFHSAQAAPTDVAVAAAPVVSPFSTFLSQLLAIVGTVVLAFAGYAAKRVMAYFEQKTKIDIPAAQEALVNKWVDQGVHLAEEKAQTWLREKRVQMPGGAKMETAFDFVWDMVQRTGLAAWTKEQIEAKINSMVNQKRVTAPVPPPPIPLSAA